MNGPTPRERARQETLATIKRLALEQLAAAGAGELSLRAIARELNLSSSAIYRYYASRDELITALIIDAYADLADCLEAAIPDSADTTVDGTTMGNRPAVRWRAVATAFRDWSRAQPHRYALIYGTPIPGYRAPVDTVAPAGRVMHALVAPLAAGSAPDGHVITGSILRGQLEVSAGALGLDVDPSTMLQVVRAAAELIGLISLELGGHFVGGFEPADELYAAAVDDLAVRCGL
ncbi:MAG TPA: TetR/AcrR family transcriptional regulator [Microlunatus sp.]|nr:TetR/AcrR family transcriptional regulator [Microlunatus sp.]